MDERLEKALDFSNYMVSLNNSKRFLEENFNQDLIYYFEGCQFTVNKELISFCQIMLNRGQDEIVLVDDNNKPLFVESVEEFLDKILDVYFTASNKYFNSYTKLLKSKKSIDSMVEL